MFGQLRLRLSRWSLAILACLTGCGSITSQLITPEAAIRGETFDGMPIVVQRPRFLKVTTKKVCYALVTTSKGAASADHPETMTSKVGMHVEWVTEIATEPLTVGEIYAIDLLRPMSGTAANSLEFASGSQYPSRVNTDVEDKSLSAMSDFIGKLLTPAEDFVGASAEEEALAAASTHKLAEHVVSIRLYDLDNMNSEPIALYSDPANWSGSTPSVTAMP